MAEQLRVMISSTARDLPEHRKEVMDACVRQGMFPIMMEHLPASDDEAIPASLKMVDESDIYLLILAHRYGYVSVSNNPAQISVTEHEYNRAVERRIPILTFVMHDDHSVKAADVEKGEGAAKLEVFKNRALLKVTNFFRTPAELRANVIDSLSHHRQKDLTAFHYVSDIPTPPEVYIAHPYTLLQTHTLIGRQKELKILTDWISGKELEFDGKKAPADSVRIMSVIAIGGMGKSALTWKWFNDVAPQEMKNLAGRMWWSFYESDATFENFVIRALAYVSKRSIQEVMEIPAPERETQLLAALDHEAFLLVLDGVERILIAYARMDAPRLDDSEVGIEKSLRKTADPRVGSFLKKLAQVKRSRILVSSRLYPTVLEASGGDPIPGAFRIGIEGLTDEDAVELWRALGVSGSRDELLPVFNTFAKHPLLIQALAGEVKRYRKAPGDFAQWRKANPQFDPSKFAKTKESMAHVLEFALRGLDSNSQRALQTIAAFRIPTSYDTLAAVSIGENVVCSDDSELDVILNELEDRGLVGWDKRANRYDLHPIVRGVVWSGLADETRVAVYSRLLAHFEAVPKIDDYHAVNSLEDLTPAIELYNTLIGLGRYDDAARFFAERLEDATLYRLSASRPRVELLKMLFPDEPEQLPLLTRQDAQAFALSALAMSYDFIGQRGRAVTLYRRGITIRSDIKDDHGLSVGLCNLSDTLRVLGKLWESESAALRSLIITRRQDDRFQEGVSLYWLGLTLAARGLAKESGYALQRILPLFPGRTVQGEGLLNFYFAQRALWLGDFAGALSLANRAWGLAHVHKLERDFIRAARAQGEAALGLNDFATADERLHHALTRARIVSLVDEELPALLAVAELRRRQVDTGVSRELLDDVWDLAERGPFPLFHADALNVLAQIERDEGDTGAAIEAATKAYQLSWCDGPPFAYHWGLEKAKRHLKELGAPEPLMPAFDESKFEPMPEVEINPRDEFYVDEGELDSE